ncbi:hypothetical protein [Streptomyces aidingensis]|uniref:Uncharacterized protein n=1 Tax=Streptomyces aidingensis TaxID=910347 RepID=A0A1I1KG32_9ACTN|nr:hypothetical protein [Streptomyces aidingensis]SFC59776.1 hypothetical protein SAMN05421773_104222 [Streptomyces aidingensis]
MPTDAMYGGPSMRYRVLVGGVVLAVLTMLAGLLACLTRGGAEPVAAPSVTEETQGAGAAEVEEPVAGPAPTEDEAHVPGAVPAEPPRTTDPVEFAKAAAEALWSYDTRSATHKEHLAALAQWVTREKRYADVASVEAQVPSPVLWRQMADNAQRATATAHEGHFPLAFEQALKENPAAITEAYVYAVTVSGKQSIAWKGSGKGGAEARAITLAVQCRPGRPCALAAVLPNVAP